MSKQKLILYKVKLTSIHDFYIPVGRSLRNVMAISYDRLGLYCRNGDLHGHVSEYSPLLSYQVYKDYQPEPSIHCPKVHPEYCDSAVEATFDEVTLHYQHMINNRYMIAATFYDVYFDLMELIVLNWNE